MYNFSHFLIIIRLTDIDMVMTQVNILKFNSYSILYDFWPTLSNKGKKRKKYFIFRKNKKLSKSFFSFKFFYKFLKTILYSLLILSFILFSEELFKEFINMEIFQLKTIKVEGNYFVPKDKILVYSGLKKGANLLKLNLGVIANEIKKISLIREVVVKKGFPGKIVIKVIERDPVFAVGKKGYLVDDEGIKLPFLKKDFDVPEIYGFDFDNRGNINGHQLQIFKKTVHAVRVFYRKQKEFPINIKAIVLRKNKLYIYSDKDYVIKISPDFNETDFEKLLCVLNDLAEKGIAIRQIDLSFQDVIVKRKKNALKGK